MRLRSFTADTLPEAMGRVRDALGPDAVILSSQPADRGKGVRVTAALEESPLENLTIDQRSDPSVSIDGIADALSFHRVPPGLFDRLLGTAVALQAGDEVATLGAALDAEFRFAQPPNRRRAQPVMLVGPPGVGKSATAAKLCAAARLNGCDASLITMDTVKSGGLAQVTTFAEALGVRLKPASDVGSLAAAVEGCPKDHFVIIDTVGANPFDRKDIARLELASQSADATPILVLPAGGDVADSAEIATAFAATGAQQMIVTKLDTARRYGGILSAAQTGRLALVAASASPNISNSLLPFNPVSLARLILPHSAGPIDTTHTEDAGR